MDTLLLDHVLKELCSIIIAYSELETYIYANDNLNVDFSCCFGEFHGTIVVYSSDRFHYPSVHHDVTPSVMHERLIEIYNEKKPITTQNLYLVGLYQFDNGDLYGEQLQCDINNKLVSSHTFNDVVKIRDV